MKRLFFVAGAGVGYVLGTKAGRQKYEQMKAKAREALERPEVHEVTDAVRSEARRLYAEGRRKLRSQTEAANHAVDSSEPGVGQVPGTTYTQGVEPASLTIDGGKPR
jgi:hypothetical protein